MIGLDGLAVPLLSFEIPGEGQFVAEGLVDDLVLGSLLHIIKQRCMKRSCTSFETTLLPYALSLRLYEFDAALDVGARLIE